VSGESGVSDPRSAAIPFVSKVETSRARRLEDEVERQRVQRDARRILEAEERQTAAAPEIVTLRELLARPDPVVE
jgi:hypothetical protein